MTSTWSKKKLYFAWAAFSHFFGGVSPSTFRRRLLARLLAVTRKRDNSRLIAAQKRYKYYHDKRVPETTVCKENELVFPDRPPLAVTANNSRLTDKLTFDKLLPRANEQYCIISVLQHTLMSNVSRVRNTISILRATPAPSDNTNARECQDRNAIKGGGVAIKSEHHARYGESAESERCSTENTQRPRRQWRTKKLTRSSRASSKNQTSSRIRTNSERKIVSSRKGNIANSSYADTTSMPTMSI